VAPVKGAFVQTVANANVASTSQSLGVMVHWNSALLNADVLS